jgi:hypothetical protein
MMENMGDTQGVISEIHTANNNMARLGLLPELQKPYRILEKLIFGGHPMARVINYITSQCQKHRDSKIGAKMKSQYDTFLRKILELEAAHKVEMKNVFDACGSNIGAGSDTTGISLSAAIYYLYRNPDKLARLREEIDMMTSKGLISDPVTYHQAKDMPCLNAVIKETLRIHPAVGTILPRVVPKGGMTLGGYHFLEGVSHPYTRYCCISSVLYFLSFGVKYHCPITDSIYTADTRWDKCLATSLQRGCLRAGCRPIPTRTLA